MLFFVTRVCVLKLCSSLTDINSLYIILHVFLQGMVCHKPSLLILCLELIGLHPTVVLRYHVVCIYFTSLSLFIEKTSLTSDALEMSDILCSKVNGYHLASL